MVGALGRAKRLPTVSLHNKASPRFIEPHRAASVKGVHGWSRQWPINAARPMRPTRRRRGKEDGAAELALHYNRLSHSCNFSLDAQFAF